MSNVTCYRNNVLGNFFPQAFHKQLFYEFYGFFLLK